MRFWANLLGYQLAWLAVVWSAGSGRAWIGMACCVAFIAAQLVVSTVRAADLRVLLAAVGCGLAIDGTFANSGLLRYAAHDSALPAPAWIVLLWGAFAMTMNHSMAWFGRHPWWAAGFAVVGGPLAYLAAARSFGAVTFPAPAFPTLLWLAVAWAVALPLLLRVANWRPAIPREVHA